MSVRVSRQDLAFVGVLVLVLVGAVSFFYVRGDDTGSPGRGEDARAPSDWSAGSGPLPPVQPTRKEGDTTFRPLAVGAGGFVTGLSFSDDGRSRVARTDVGGAYRWSGDQWRLTTPAESLPSQDVRPGMDAGVLAVAVAPSDSSIIYLAYNDALYRSGDAGKRWRRVLSGVTTAANDNFRVWGSRLAVDPADPDAVFYGSQLDGLFVTRDAGSSWSQVRSVPSGLLVDIDDAGERGDVDRPTTVSEDGRRSGGAGVSAVAVDRSGPVSEGRSQVVYAASYGEGVYRSEDGGDSWVKVSPPEVGGVGYLRVLDNGEVLATAHEDPTDLNGVSTVWRFDGEDWSVTGPSQEENWRTIAVDSTTPGRVALMGTNAQLALSQDYGESWALLERTQTSEGDVPWLAWALEDGGFMSNGEIVFDPVVPGRLWFAEGIGVWHADLDESSESLRWRSRSRGIEELVPTGVVAPPGGQPVVTAWDRAIFRSEDPEKYPTHYEPAREFSSAWSIDWAVDDPEYLVASVASHQWPSDPSASGFSTDGGKSWSTFPTIPQSSDNAVTTFGFGSVAVSERGNVVWVPAYGKRPEYTTDGGETWSPITLPGIDDYSLVNNKPYFVNRQVVAADKSRAGTFYLYVMDAGTYRSRDGGASWEQMSSQESMPASDYQWKAVLKAAPGREGELFMTPGQLGGTTTQPFLHSTDAGATWNEVVGLTGVTAFGFGRAFPRTQHPATYVAGYLKGRYGIYRSTDGAASWTYLTDYPAGRTPHVVTVDGDKDVVGRVYLGIAGSGWVYGSRRAEVTR